MLFARLQGGGGLARGHQESVKEGGQPFSDPLSNDGAGNWFQGAGHTRFGHPTSQMIAAHYSNFTIIGLSCSSMAQGPD